MRLFQYTILITYFSVFSMFLRRQRTVYKCSECYCVSCAAHILHHRHSFVHFSARTCVCVCVCVVLL
jgi:hypothetical protein